MFWERFIGECERIGKKPNAIRKELGISSATLTNWKNGSLPSARSLNKLTAYFGVTADYLLGKTDQRTASQSNTVPLSRKAEYPTRQSGDFPETIPYENRGKRPVVGNVSAGTGTIASQDIIGWQSVDSNYDNEDCFWLRVSGDSMAPMLENGDLVLVDKTAQIDNGNIVVALIDNEGFIKKIELHDDTVTLVSFNPYYPPMVFPKEEAEKIYFVGKAVELKRGL